MGDSIQILVTDGLAANGLSLLEKEARVTVHTHKQVPAEDLLKIIPSYHVLVVRSATTVTASVIEKGKNLRLIARAGAGVDNVDLEAATRNKIPVMNAASANSMAAAELTIGMMYSVARMIPQAHFSMKEKKWDRETFKGIELSGKTCGVIGLGNIGRIVAEKSVGIGMRVIGFDPVFSKKNLAIPNVAVTDQLDELVKNSDVITLHIPKTKTTEKTVDREFLSKMKKGSILIHCARGGIVDEAAVLSALESGHLFAAGFDVFEKEPADFSSGLFRHPRVVTTPHIGAMSLEAQDRVASTTAQQILGYFFRGEKHGIVNNV